MAQLETPAAARVPPGRLVLVCGLPGSGKTTLATELARRATSIRLSADDWMASLGASLWQADLRSGVEALQWTVAKHLLLAGFTVVLEWGTWSRSERDGLRIEARSLGAGVELHFLDASDEELWQRIRRRNAEDPPITRADVATWRARLEPPTQAERALFDPPAALDNGR